MLRSLDLNTSVENSAVHAFTTQTVARLSPVDATLPQVLTVCEMVKRGIGVVREINVVQLDVLPSNCDSRFFYCSTTEDCCQS